MYANKTYLGMVVRLLSLLKAVVDNELSALSNSCFFSGEKYAIIHRIWHRIRQKQEECEIEGFCNVLNKLKESNDEKNITI